MAEKTKIRFRSLINRSSKEIYDWHLRRRVVERCIPPSDVVEVLSFEGRPDTAGSKAVFRFKFLKLFWSKVVIEYIGSEKNASFSSRQVEGFFNEYSCDTVINPQSDHTSEIIDNFEFIHSFPKIFNPLINKYLKKRLGKILAYKHALIDHDIGMIKKYPLKAPMKVLISGSHGLIGKNLSYFLEFMGLEVHHLVRRSPGESNSVVWDPNTSACNIDDFEGFDAVIHLAGENLATGRWTKQKKARVLTSRAKSTEHLVEIIKKLEKPPKVFISASAIGYYGNRGSEVLTEDSDPGKGLFITDVCEKWERASKDLDEIGVRALQTRFGIVLSGQGGALKKMLNFFALGLGGQIGNGHQYMSWVALDDVFGALFHAIMTPSLKGPVNVVSPNPVPNDRFSKKLASHLHRWLGPPIPDFAIKLFMGQKGEELLLTSARVEPKKLLESGYHFHYPKLCQALMHVI